ncbi:NAD-glutamate dehydrogenase [Altererythrobacter sp. MTPC7]|uniref:NAD-glutamate dehydrogenase n=1 Tax=Altererythrobacter sp. MTPC7 TaxID=3056567 RepID=UPI0036F30DFB
MGSKNNAEKSAPSKQAAALQKELAKRLKASLLPSDTPFTGAELQAAARFLFDAASLRKAGETGLSLVSETGDRRFLRIAIVNADMPFLVDSVAATLAAHGLVIDHLIHPVIAVERDSEGCMTALPAKPGDACRESMIYLETDRVDAKKRREIEEALLTTLGDVRASVRDWPRLQEEMAADAAAIAERASDEEGAALLQWLNDGMLTQLGHVTRHRDGSHSDLLGICRRSAKQILAEESYERAFDWFDRQGDDAREPLVIKANRVSNVHRRIPLDLFIVPRRDASGKVEALSIHAGVWTSAALAAPPAAVPRLRSQLAELMDTLGFDPLGHAGKALVHALTRLPHDLLVGFEAEDLRRITTTMISLVDRPRAKIALVEAPLARHVFAFAWLPRDSMSTAVRHQITGMLEEMTGARLLDWSLEIEGGTLAMLRFVLDNRQQRRQVDETAVEERLQSMLRGWGEAVETELADIVSPQRAAALAMRYGSGFSASYRARYGAREAALDIDNLRQLGTHEEEDAGGPQRSARLYHLDGDPQDRMRLKVYQHHGSLPLSDAVPELENFGFRVLEEIPNPVDNGDLGTVHDFLLETLPGIESRSVLDRAATIESAIAAVLNDVGEDDAFNRLVVGAGMDAQEAEWLRAIYRYLRQTGMGFTIYTVVDALARAPQVTAALIALFRAKHDPAFEGDRDKAIKEARSAIKSGLARVAAINDDRLLRLYHGVIEAMLRTNAFAPDTEALAFKMDSAKVPGLPLPLPWREIFVYSRRVEGIHLRAGPVARGGLRWSDRRDDFRTEILGLMKAQRVKNAVIVPSGAKGGFYPKQLPDPATDREGWAAEGQASYEVFIRTLLSITDNLEGDKVVHPEGVHIRDGADPYFVVAADKGTARFSDVANAIAIERGFWLGDAFASGGSNGYDHKAMGITARGAWVSVQRHFREMGVDVQSDPVSVVGCGDMSGDVFGNGMLLSKSIRLIAAFDHRHIFIDPEPDAAKSWKERKRLFDLPRSSWDDYDRDLISKGGGVYPRTAKTIKLSAAARRALGVEAGEMEPEALISAILKAPADLLWFGGIGTYVKGSGENNIQVGDPANDALRVNGEDVRARVIGEGANLGITQAGRIEFALEGAGGAGGRINTDFIDNSAGVDCSDNEVNIKIALEAARRSGKLSEKRRIELLESMTDDVADIVLEDNRLQALALSIASHGGAESTGSLVRLMETLEERGALDRQTEGLADTESLVRRSGDGAGLTRPELAVLLSSTKLVLQDAIEESGLPDDPAMEKPLLDYFPEAMRRKFSAQIEDHRLRREIAATGLANRIVNRMGIIHPFELAEEEGVGLAEVAIAFVAVERLLGMDEIWDALDTGDMPESIRLQLFDRVATAMRIHMADLLRACPGTRSPSAIIDTLQDEVAELTRATANLLGAENRQRSARMRAEFAQAGAPEVSAHAAAHLFDLDGAIGLAKLSEDLAIDPRALTSAFTDLGARLGLDWAQGVAALMNPSDVWERLLVSGLARDFQQMRFDFLKRLSRRKGAKNDPAGAVADWAEDNAAAIRQFGSMIGRAQAHTPVAPAMLAQIASQARNLLAR